MKIENMFAPISVIVGNPIPTSNSRETFLMVSQSKENMFLSREIRRLSSENKERPNTFGERRVGLV